MDFDLSGLQPLDTSGLEAADDARLDVSGLTPLDTSGLEEIGAPPAATKRDTVENPFPPASARAAQQPAEPGQSEDSWLDVGRKVVENVPRMFQKAAGGLVQSLGEAPADPGGTAGMFLQGSSELAAEQQVARERQQAPGGLDDIGREIATQAEEALKRNRPNVDPESLKGYGYDIAAGIVNMAPAIAASIATRNPAAGLAIIGGQVYGDQYAESREKGRTPEQARGDAVFYAAAEAIPEALPLGILTKEGGRFLTRVLKASGAEGAQEMFTEALQAGYDAGVIGDDMTWGQAWDRIKRAGIVGAGTGGGLAIGTHPLTRERNPLDRVDPTAFTPEQRRAQQLEAARRFDPNRGSDLAPPNVTAADVASPINTADISAGRSIIDELLAPKESTPVEVPQGAVPAEVLLGRVEESTPAEQPAPPAETAAAPQQQQEDAVAAAPALDVSGLAALEERSAEPSSAAPEINMAPPATPQPDAALPETRPVQSADTPPAGLARPSDVEPAAAPSPAPAEPLTLAAAQDAMQGRWWHRIPQDEREAIAGRFGLGTDAFSRALDRVGYQAAPAAPMEPARPEEAPAPAAAPAPSEPTPILKKDGTPFGTEKAAALAARSRPDLKGKALQAVEVEGGWGLMPVPAETPKKLWADMTAAERETRQRARDEENFRALQAEEPSLTREEYDRRKASGMAFFQDMMGVEPRQGAVTKAPASAVPARAPTPPNVTQPQSLFQFLASRGGIKDEGGEMRTRDLHKRLIPRSGPLVRNKSGLSLDQARAAAEEAGYIVPSDRAEVFGRTEVRDLLDAIDREARGQKVYPIDRQADASEAQRAVRQADEEASRRTAAESDVAAVLEEHGAIPDDLRRQAVDDVMRGVDPEDAVIAAIERDALQTQDEVRAEPGREEFDIPFEEPVRAQQQGIQGGRDGVPQGDAEPTADVRTDAAEGAADRQEPGRRGPDRGEAREGEEGRVIGLDPERGRRAYSGMSFSPEKRAASDIQGFERAVQGLRDELSALAQTDQQRAAVAEQVERYRQGYITHQNAIWDAKSRTMSPMITGPANFPVARNQKRMETERKRVEEFITWDKRARAAARKAVQSAGVETETAVQQERQAPETIAEYDGAEVVADRTDDRLRIYFTGKPTEDVRADLRGAGWKWSPRNEAWQRQLTNNARYSAERILGKHFEKKAAEAPAETESEAPTLEVLAPVERAGIDTPHPEWATQHEQDVGGRVVYSDDEVALVEGFSILTGAPVYAGVLKSGQRTRVDIEAFTGNAFTPEQRERLIEAKRRYRAADDEEHQRNPDGPFGGGERFAASPNFPADLASVARGWLDMLGIKARVYLTTTEDARAATDMRGPFAAIRSAGLDANEKGSARKLANGDHYVAVKLAARRSENLEVLAHEIGHILEKEAWKDADAATKSAVTAAYQRWLEGAKNANAAEWVRGMRAHTTGKLTAVQADVTADRLPPYWRSFSEWFADQVARWSVSAEAPSSVVDRFFSRIARALKRLYASAAGKGLMPTSEMKVWLDSRAQAATPDANPLQGSVAVTERTDQGEQILIDGVRPVTDRDRAEVGMAKPLRPKRAQKAADEGLFDTGARSQTELFRVSPEFARALPDVERELRARFERLGIADRVALRLVDVIRDTTGRTHQDASGRYLRGVIDVALSSRDRVGTLGHETVHALRDLGLFRDAEWAALREGALADADLMERTRFYYADRNLTEDRLVEEAIAEWFGDWYAGRAQAKGFVRTAFQRIADFFRAVGQVLRGQGFRTPESVFRAIERGEVGRRGVEEASAADDLAEAFQTDGGERFQIRRTDVSEPGAAEERRALMTRLAGVQPLDRIARIPFDLFGAVNERNEWEYGARMFDRAGRFIERAEFKPDGRFAFMNPILHKARAGLIDRYGLDPAYIERERVRGLDERRIMAQVPELMETLKKQDVTPEEMTTLQAVLTGEEVPDARWAKIAGPIRESIDQLGAEAVQLGLLSPEAYERNRGTYLHRVYAKHEADTGPLAAWVSRIMTGRRRKIIGNQFKGRGMFMEVAPGTLMRHTDEAQTERTRSGRLKFLEKRRDELIRRREVAVARAEERQDDMGATLERRLDTSERLPDPAAARAAERTLQALRDRRADVERQRAEAVAELETLTGESEATLGRRMDVSDAARGAKRDGTPTLKPSSYQKGQAREQGVALSRQSRQAERVRETLARLDHELSRLDRRIERVSGDVIPGREGIEGRAREQGAALTRQRLRSQRAQGLLSRIDGQLAEVNAKIVETETKLFAAGEVKAEPGRKFLVLDRMEPGPDGKERVTHRAYVPADQPIPERFRDYQERGEWEVRGAKGKDGGGKVVLWRDFTKDERRQMGEIVDARYTIAKTYMLMAHDLATGRFFRDIAQNAEWSRDGKDEPPAGSWKDASEYSRFSADPTVKWVKVPDAVISGSRTKRYGSLAGRFVRAEIWRDLSELEAMQKPNLWDSIMRQFKANKTVRSPVVHMNNIMSNVMFMDMADIRVTDLARGMRALVKKDAVYREAVEHGAFGSDMLAQEIRESLLKPILEDIERQGRGDQGRFLDRIGAVGKLADRLWAGLKTADRKMMEAYQAEDEVFRMALYLRRREQGASPAQAAVEARDQFVNYDIRAPWINAARRTVLPFASYTYRAVPMIAKTVATRPWKLAKYFTIAYALNALAYAIAPGDEDEERRSMREAEQGNAWIGAERMQRLPMMDEQGNPLFLDIRRWIPGGDVFDTTQGQSVLPVPAWMMPGGPLAIAGELWLNRSAFTGQDIVNKATDDLWDRSVKTGDYVYKSWMPSAAWIPGSWYWERISNAIDGARDWSGRPYSVPQAVASSVGIKVKPQDVNDGFASWAREFDKTERELHDQGRRLARDADRGLITQERFEREMERVTEKLERLAQRRDETFNGKAASR